VGAPVVHFEILSRNAEALQKFFSELFDWRIDTNNPQNYGLVDTQAGSGIPGGIGAPQQGDGWVTVYVQVDNLQKYLDRAESLGGKTLMPPTAVSDEVTLAMFADPDGHVIGMTQGE
jgi:uncharacterized protein